MVYSPFYWDSEGQADAGVKKGIWTIKFSGFDLWITSVRRVILFYALSITFADCCFCLRGFCAG